jgi:hypothetical protein
LIVDPERLNSASTILGKAAGEIPVGLPKFSVPGTDPLSMAIAAGSAKVEAPMAALPGIKADATSTAQKIGTAGQMYATADQELAEKARQHRFAIGEAGAGGGQPKPPQLTRANPNVVPLEEIERQRKDLQGKIMDRAREVAGTASDKIGKAVMNAPEAVSQGLQKWFKDPGKLGFESGFTRPGKWSPARPRASVRESRRAQLLMPVWCGPGPRRVRPSVPLAQWQV